MIYWRSCESSAFRAAALFLCPFSSTPPCRKIKGFPDVQQDGPLQRFVQKWAIWLVTGSVVLPARFLMG